jgi:hypothetical protein
MNLLKKIKCLLIDQYCLSYCGCSGDGAGGDASSAPGDDGGDGSDGPSAAQSIAANEPGGFMSPSNPDNLTGGFQTDMGVFFDNPDTGGVSVVSNEEVDAYIDSVAKPPSDVGVTDLSVPHGIDISQSRFDEIGKLMEEGRIAEAEKQNQTNIETYGHPIGGRIARTIDDMVENPISTIATFAAPASSIAGRVGINTLAGMADALVMGREVDVSAKDVVGNIAGAAVGREFGREGAKIGYDIAGPIGAYGAGKVASGAGSALARSATNSAFNTFAPDQPSTKASSKTPGTDSPTGETVTRISASDFDHTLDQKDIPTDSSGFMPSRITHPPSRSVATPKQVSWYTDSKTGKQVPIYSHSDGTYS